MSKEKPTSKFLNSEARGEIRRAIPDSEWDKFSGLKHVAVSATERKLLDGDNDLVTLTNRVRKNYPDDQIFIATGKMSLGLILDGTIEFDDKDKTSGRE